MGFTTGVQGADPATSLRKRLSLGALSPSLTPASGPLQRGFAEQKPELRSSAKEKVAQSAKPRLSLHSLDQVETLRALPRLGGAPRFQLLMLLPRTSKASAPSRASGWGGIGWGGQRLFSLPGPRTPIRFRNPGCTICLLVLRAGTECNARENPGSPEFARKIVRLYFGGNKLNYLITRHPGKALL